MRAFGRRALMRRAGMSQHTLEKVERGGRVRAKTLQLVQAALDADISGPAGSTPGRDRSAESATRKFARSDEYTNTTLTH